MAIGSRIRPLELKHNQIGIIVGISTTLGLVVGQLTLVTLGFGFGTMGPAFIFAMVAALILSFFQIFSFSELATMYPRAGSIFDYVDAGLGLVLGTVAVLTGYVLVAIFAVSAELQIGGIAIKEVWLGSTPWWMWGLLIAGLIFVVNVIGVRYYGFFDVAVTAILLALMVVTGALGLSGAGKGEPIVGLAHSTVHLPDFMGFVTLAFFLYLGFEYVCPLADEIRRPRRNLPLSMFIGLVLVFVCQAAFGFAYTRWVPLKDLAGSAIPHILFLRAQLGGIGNWLVGIVGVTATLSSIDSVYAAGPRILYGMGKEGHLPRIFAYVHPRFRTPTFAILFIAVCTIAPFPAGTGSRTILILILASTFAWIVSYALVHLSVISLRFRAPGHARPFRSPLFPLPQLLGLGGLSYMLTKISPDPSLTNDVYIYSGSLVFASAVFAVLWDQYRRRRRIPVYQEEPAA